MLDIRLKYNQLNRKSASGTKVDLQGCESQLMCPEAGRRSSRCRQDPAVPNPHHHSFSVRLQIQRLVQIVGHGRKFLLSNSAVLPRSW